MKALLASGKPLLIFTDLDGSLLDHHSYSFEPAAAALQQIARRGIPLVINSSKTFAEIIPIQQALGICQPFICENGAAVFQPEQAQLTTPARPWQRQDFTVSREQVLAIVHKLRTDHGYSFTGFADCDAAGIVALTGLSLEQAAHAGQRDYSEPLQWQGSDSERRAFVQHLQQAGLDAQQGGRFLTVMGNTANKAVAMDWLARQYHADGECVTLALGDSLNDQPMLEAADIAVVIKSARSAHIQLKQPRYIIRTRLSGPAGWQQAMDQVFAAMPSS